MNNLEEQFNQAEEMLNRLNKANTITPVSWHGRIINGGRPTIQTFDEVGSFPWEIMEQRGPIGIIGHDGIEGVPGEGLMSQIERPDRVVALGLAIIANEESLTKRTRKSKRPKIKENTTSFLDNVVKNDSI